MATKNNITGDSIISKKTTDLYRDNYDRIFGKKDEEPWYVTEYNAGVWVNDLFYKALCQEDTEAQNWIINKTNLSAIELIENREV